MFNNSFIRIGFYKSKNMKTLFNDFYKNIFKITASVKKNKRKFFIPVLLFLTSPLSVFAACGDINSIGMFNFAVVTLIIFTPFFLFNIDYIKRSFDSEKFSIFNFAPLAIAPILSYIYVKVFLSTFVLSQQIFFNTLNKTITLLLIYYFIFLLYGINIFRNEDRSFGGDIIKFCVSMIIAISAIMGFLKVMINIAGC